MTGQNKKRLLQEIYKAAIEAASPYTAVRGALRTRTYGKKLLLEIQNESIDLSRVKRVFVAGAGKAVCPMARAIEDMLAARVTDGLVITKYGHGQPLKRVRVKEAGHPIPDSNGMAGAKEILDMAKAAEKDDLFIFLLTGGASSLLSFPAPGLSLKDKQRASALLLNSGATIDEMNAVRKHLSLIKGGRLAEEAIPARVLTLMVSDVVGNSLSTIGSGPTAPDPSTYSDSLKVIDKYGLSDKMPMNVMKLLRKGAKGGIPESPKPGSPAFRRASNIIVADNLWALQSAAKAARAAGLHTIVLSSTVAGNTRETAAFLASVLKEIKNSGNPVKRPACVLIGGETTLVVTGKGLGGRNQEFALALAVALDGKKGVYALAAGTDGTDGPTDAAGAYVSPESLKKAAALGLDPLKFLSRNDSYNFFKKAGGLFVTGPTGTNVMDIVIGMVE